jgi:hypothetical protein
MSRCGCNSTNSTTCTAIMDCIAANVGLGLEVVGGQLQVRISQDADNATDFGSDDGLFTPVGGVGPGEQAWRWTVDTLPAQTMAAAGASNLVGPSTQQQLIQHAIANGTEMYSTTAIGATDGTAIEVITTSLNQSVTQYTDNPGPLTWAQTASIQMLGFNYDAGTRVNPTGDNSGAPSAFLTPYGGWGGFYANQYPGRTLAETLRYIRGRMVVNISIPRLGLTNDQIEQSVTSMVTAVVDAGAQDWCIIQVPGYFADDSQTPIADWVPIITDAGIAAGVNMAQAAAVTNPWVAASIVASGATWTTVVRNPASTANVTDARITELVGLGLEVITITNARQYWTDYCFDLGARAVQSSDAVYAAGGRAAVGDVNYRLPYVPGFETGTTALGALTYVTDSSTAMWEPGFARSDLPGRWFPEEYGWSGTTAVIRNHQLIGTICPHPDTTNYRIEIRIRRETFAGTNNRSAGLFVAVPDDRGVSHLNGSSVNPDADGYIAALNSRTVGTTMALQRVTNGVATTLGSVTTGTVTYVANAWITLGFNVTPSGVTFTATNGPTNTITNADTTWRGAYVYYIWDDTLGGMVHGYTNPVDLVTYEEL